MRRDFFNMKLEKYLKEYVLGEEMLGLVIGLFWALTALISSLGLAFWIAGRLTT